MLLPYNPLQKFPEPYHFEIWEQLIARRQFAAAMELLILTHRYLKSITNLIPNPDIDLMHTAECHAVVKCLHRLVTIVH